MSAIEYAKLVAVSGSGKVAKPDTPEDTDFQYITLRPWETLLVTVDFQAAESGWFQACFDVTDAAGNPIGDKEFYWTSRVYLNSGDRYSFSKQVSSNRSFSVTVYLYFSKDYSTPADKPVWLGGVTALIEGTIEVLFEKYRLCAGDISSDSVLRVLKGTTVKAVAVVIVLNQVATEGNTYDISIALEDSNGNILSKKYYKLSNNNTNVELNFVAQYSTDVRMVAYYNGEVAGKTDEIYLDVYTYSTHPEPEPPQPTPPEPNQPPQPIPHINWMEAAAIGLIIGSVIAIIIAEGR